MISVIAFDYGGVIEVSDMPNVTQSIADYLGVSLEEFRAVYYQYNYLSNVEGKSWAHTLTVAAQQFSPTPETETAVRTILLTHETARSLNQELLQLIRGLRSAGYTTAIVSNYNTELRSHIQEQRIDHLFDTIVVSGEIGCQKPDPAIFAYLFKELAVAASEVVFIDDTPRSLETADAVGYQPILFTDNAALIRDLQALSVVLPRAD